MNQNLNLTSSVASKPHAHPRLPTGVLASRLKEAAGGTPVDNLSAEVILPKNPKNHPQILATKRILFIIALQFVSSPTRAKTAQNPAQHY